MRAAQNLYEKGLITYMRTDSPHLAPEALTAIHKALQERFGEKAVRPRTWESRSTHAQEAHEAIRPTDPTVAEAGDTADEQKLYHLIWRRTLATQMPDAVYEETLAQLEPEHATEPPLQFEARGRTLLQAGFLELYGYAEEEETPTLPPLQEGQLWKWKSVRLWEKFNTPPARYTEGTLVRELEARGIGRPSTYAPTVETLFKRGYIRRENIRLVKPPFKEVFLYPDGTLEEQRQTPPAEVQKNKLVPTELGAQVVDFLVGRFPDIMNYDFTAQVEEELDQIAAEKLDWQEMLNAFYAHFTAELEQAQNSRQAFQHRVLGYDPVSQKPIYLHIGRKGPFVALGEKGDPDHRTASVPSALALDTLSLEAALELLSFPRPIGEYEGHPITIHSGPYGYYLKHQGQNKSLLPGMSPFSLTVEEAIEAIEAKRAKAQGAEVLLSFPEAGITIVKGRYGPYIRHPAGTCSIPKSTPVSKLTLDDCQKLIAQKQKQLSSRRSKTSPKASSSRTKR
jgi:DNA topoisomerase-1